VSILNSHDENEESRKIAQKIQKLLDSGVAPNDIAILYRVKVLSRSIEEGLNRMRIAYKLVGGLRFYDRAEIKDLISYIRVLTNHHDDFSFKRIVNKPKRGLGKASVDKIEMMAHNRGVSLFEYLDTADFVELESLVRKKNATTLKQFIADLKEVAQLAKESIYNFVDILEDKFHLKEIYKNTQDADEKVLNIDEFYALFRDFIKKNPDLSLDEFLNELTLQSDQDQVEGESIYMMSIHASKGLEFEHVFIVGAVNGMMPSMQGEPEAIDKHEQFKNTNLEEERRLFYVAVTRAKDQLMISSPKYVHRFGSVSEHERTMFLDGLEHLYKEEQVLSSHNKSKEVNFLEEKK